MAPKKQPSPEVQALLDRAKQGAWLTKAETDVLLGFNQGYTFRYVAKEWPPKEGEAKRVWEAELFKTSLTSTEPRWRMLGRSEPILQPVKDCNEFISLYVTQNQEGGYDWDVVDEYDLIVKGKEPTILRAALVGGRAYEVEMYKREFVEPEDFKEPARALRATSDDDWGLTELIKWAIKQALGAYANPSVEAGMSNAKLEEDVVAFLLELPHEQEPKEAYRAMRRYRKLNTKARLAQVHGVVRWNGVESDP